MRPIAFLRLPNESRGPEPIRKRLAASSRPPWKAIPAALLFLAAACNSGTPTPDLPMGGTPAPEATVSPDEVVWALDAQPTSLDAGRMTLVPERGAIDPAGNQVVAQIYDRLVSFRPGTAQLAPGIAQNWQANLAENSFTFTLREGLTFQDGTPLDARAVVWNFQRWMDPDHPQHHGAFPSWEGLFGYLGQQDGGGNDAFLVERVEAIGPLQVRFRLKAPFSPFLQHLAMAPFGLASPTAVEAQGEAYGSDGAHLPVGSGPYRVLGWDENGIRLAPFGRHWSGIAKSAGLRFIVEPDAQARAQAVVDGRAHATELGPTTAISGSLTAPGMRLQARPPRATAWLMLNHNRAPLDNPNVRRALSMALDRQRLAGEHFGALSDPAAQLLPPGWLGHAEDLEAPPFDPEGARKILEEEGISGTFRLNIFVPDSPRSYLPDPEGTANAVGAMLETIGITPSVRTVGLRQFLSDRDAGRFTAWIAGWEAQSPDPDIFWFFNFGIPARFASEGHYQNGELARSLTEAQRLDTDSRRVIYEAAAHTVDEATARIFLAHARPLLFSTLRLQGLQPGPMGFDDLSSLVLAEAAPAGAGDKSQGLPSPIPLDPLASPSTKEGTETPAEATGTSGDEEGRTGAEAGESSPTDKAGENDSP